MKKFDNHVQYVKYSVLKEILKSELKDNLLKDLLNIPKKIAPGPKPQIRCCIYKERAIVGEDRKSVV